MRNHFKRLLFIVLLGPFSAAALADSELVQRVRADYDSLSQALSDFDKARESGALSAAEEADFEEWITYLASQVQEGCRALTLEASTPVPSDLPCKESLNGSPMPAGIDVSAEQTQGEKTAALVDQLHSALGKFDEELLQEQEKVKAQTPRTDAQDMASVEENMEGNEEDTSQGESEQGDARGGDSEESAVASTSPGNEDGAEEGGDAQQRQTASNAESTIGNPDQTTSGGVPEDIPDGSDDDVVARQLREAAEKETDPELKKKLWEEYKRYKAGTG